MRRSYPFHILATLLFALFALLIAGLAGAYVYLEHRALLLPTLEILSLGLALSLPLVWWIARRTTASLRQLVDAAAAIKSFRFDVAAAGSHIAEIDALATTMRQMSATIQRFIDISAHLSATRHYDRLLADIVAETLAEAEAGAGAVYLFGDDGKLQPMAWQRAAGKPPLPPAAVDPRKAPVFADALARPEPGQFVLPPTHALLGLAWVSGWFPGQYVQVLMVPLRNHAGDRLGLLLLARGAEAGGYPPALVAFIAALAGTIAVTIEKQRLLDGRQALLDGIIRMIAGAIDARSPYTSGHCRRVPELVAMLADAAATHPASPCRDAPLDENAREALHLAAWLHDCGKLFVPDYITDKAVKLETVYNRIHEIRTRFEVLKRDAEIACWRGIAAGGDAAALRRELEAAWQSFDADFAFVADCNRGDRQLGADDLARLERIGSRTWLRTLDDRLGIAAPELARKAAVPPRPLPAPEHLLADRLEHLIDSAPQWGSTGGRRMSPPRHRLNCGELYSLGVASGTLTPEERYLINAHILGTIAMLSALPFPRELASVPDTAGSHHEHLDGSGYPAGKRAAELPLAARIIAIADVFEALTAADRPYKRGKTADEALALMAEMAGRGHLDPALFNLFVQADIPARYAAAHGTTTEAPAV